jgi:Uma2 family endonuclease
MPDLAVEVFSPDDDYQDLKAKAKYYLQNGSQLVWLVYPKSQTVEICTLTETGDIKTETVGIDGVLDGGAVLPEFTLPVRDIFPE